MTRCQSIRAGAKSPALCVYTSVLQHDLGSAFDPRRYEGALALFDQLNELSK